MADAIDSHIGSSDVAEYHGEGNEAAITESTIAESQEHPSDSTSANGDHDHHELETKQAEGECQ